MPPTLRAGLSRRTLARMTSLGAVAVLAQACGATSLPVIAQDATAILNAATTAVNALPVGTVATGVLAQITAYMADIKAAATAISGGSTTASVAQQLYNAAKAILPILAGALALVPGVGTGVSIALGAISALLPEIATFAGLTALAAAPAPLPPAAAKMVAPVTPDQARRLFGS